MAKKQYRVEINNVTTEVLAELKNASVDFILYEVNKLKHESDSFAGGSNFATTQIILKPVEEMDTTDYKEQEIKNYTANLSRNIPYVMTKEVRL